MIKSAHVIISVHVTNEIILSRFFLLFITNKTIFFHTLVVSCCESYSLKRRGIKKRLIIKLNLFITNKKNSHTGGLILFSLGGGGGGGEIKKNNLSMKKIDIWF